MTDLMQKQKPWENKLLKNPKKRIKQKIQERVQMDFKNKKELPRYIRTLEASRNSIEKEEVKQCNSEESEENISYISDQVNRVSILDFIRKCLQNEKGYVNIFRQCSQISTEGNYKLKIHGFASLCSAVLDLELEERNTNAIFLTIDTDKNGHIDEDEFIQTVATLKDNRYPQKACARFVIDQVYQELIGSTNLSLALLNRKLDKEGFINVSDLMVYLSKYNIDLNEEEIDLMFEQNGRINSKGDRQI